VLYSGIYNMLRYNLKWILLERVIKLDSEKVQQAGEFADALGGTKLTRAILDPEIYPGGFPQSPYDSDDNRLSDEAIYAQEDKTAEMETHLKRIFGTNAHFSWVGDHEIEIIHSDRIPSADSKHFKSKFWAGRADGVDFDDLTPYGSNYNLDWRPGMWKMPEMW